MNEKLNKILQNSIKKRRLFIGGTMVLDSDFNIKNYLSDVQKQVLLEKIYCNGKRTLPKINKNSHRLITNNYSCNYITMNNNNNEKEKENSNKIKHNLIFNTNVNDKKPLVTLNNLLTLSKDNLFNIHKSDSIRKNNIIITDINVEKKLFDANNAIQSTKNKIEKMIKKNKESAKSYNSIFHNKLFKSNEPRLNITKAIKEIKKREKSYNYMNTIEGKNKKMLQKNKTIDNDIVAFDKRNQEAVFEPLKIMNEYKRQKDFQINYQETSMNKFNSQNRQLSISNILIKLMNNESSKLSKKYHSRIECLKKNEKTIGKDETNLEDYIETHKNICKNLEQLYIDIQNKNKELIDENINCNSEIKVIKDEMRKELNQIEYLRIYGYFVNKVLGGDTTRFETKIFPEPKFYDEIDIDALSQNVIEKYRCFYDNVEGEKFEQEKTFINEPEKMWFKFEEMKGIMVRNIFTKEIIKGDIKKIIEDKNKNLKHLRQKNEFLEKENKIIKEQYEYELSKYNIIEKRYNYHKNEFDDLIQNFYIYINNYFGQNNAKNSSDKKNINFKLEIVDCMKEINKILTDKEVYIDKLMSDLKNWEKNDTKCFEDVVNNRKKQIKHLKQLKLMKEKENSRFKFINNIESGKYKLILNSRKTEAPYHKPKKVVEEKLDEKLVQQIENEELINYEGD